MSRSNRGRAFTIVELLVSISIIVILIGVLLPAIGKARDQARVSTSVSNLRQLGQALAAYAAEWNDRQVTLVDDNLGRYGSSVSAAIVTYQQANQRAHPGIIYGWGLLSGGQRVMCGRAMNAGNSPLIMPISFVSTGPFGSHFGWFRITNVVQINRYLNGQHYDPIFYAPKDRVVLEAIDHCLEAPDEMRCTPNCWHVNIGGWPTYCLSPAGLYAPQVMRNEGAGGWQDPFDLDAGFRAPAMSQALYPDLKTHMLEHHWLQNARADCNPGFVGVYNGCEPYYFNHSWESVPVSLFFDGHVGPLGVRESEQADARLRSQTGTHGTWNRSTPWGGDGYVSDIGYDFATTSFHILTNDGIRGRDRLAR
ncbi:MAG: type II secretion system protein [Planctomycetota bacterium]|jgi:type II secretory pathway pseudopilin PulG